MSVNLLDRRCVRRVRSAPAPPLTSGCSRPRRADECQRRGVWRPSPSAPLSRLSVVETLTRDDRAGAGRRPETQPVESADEQTYQMLCLSVSPGLRDIVPDEADSNMLAHLKQRRHSDADRHRRSDSSTATAQRPHQMPADVQKAVADKLGMSTDDLNLSSPRARSWRTSPRTRAWT